MKKSISFSLITGLITIFCVFTQVSLTSCKKETITVYDTIPAPTLTNTELLTRNAWMADEAWQVDGGIRTYYKRGVSNNTGNNYDALRLTFNANGTGTNTDTNGSTYNMTWQFTSNDENNMKLVVNGTAIYNWSLVDISEEAILQTATFDNGDLVTGRWVPVP